MTVEYIEAMKDCCKGQSVAILGGSASLVQDIKALPPTTQLWGVNQHTAILPLTLIVFIDSKLWPYIKDYHTKFITRTAECDETNKDIIRVRQQLSHNYSGALAFFAADKMGFDTIYVAGMDQYDLDADRTYWWEGPQSPDITRSRRLCTDGVPVINFIKTLRRPQNIHFMSGRLKELHQ